MKISRYLDSFSTYFNNFKAFFFQQASLHPVRTIALVIFPLLGVAAACAWGIRKALYPSNNATEQKVNRTALDKITNKTNPEPKINPADHLGLIEDPSIVVPKTENSSSNSWKKAAYVTAVVALGVMGTLAALYLFTPIDVGTEILPEIKNATLPDALNTGMGFIQNKTRLISLFEQTVNAAYNMNLSVFEEKICLASQKVNTVINESTALIPYLLNKTKIVVPENVFPALLQCPLDVNLSQPVHGRSLISNGICLIDSASTTALMRKYAIGLVGLGIGIAFCTGLGIRRKWQQLLIQYERINAFLLDAENQINEKLNQKKWNIESIIKDITEMVEECHQLDVNFRGYEGKISYDISWDIFKEKFDAICAEWETRIESNNTKEQEYFEKFKLDVQEMADLIGDINVESKQPSLKEIIQCLRKVYQEPSNVQHFAEYTSPISRKTRRVNFNTSSEEVITGSS